MASAVMNRTSFDYLDYLMQQERLITLPLRTVAELLLTVVVMAHPTQRVLLDLLYLSWAVTAIHIPWSLLWLRRDNVRRLYLGVALIDTLLLSGAIAFTGGVTSPFLLAIPVQAVRVVKGSFGGRIGHYGLIATLCAGAIGLAPWLAFGGDSPRGIEVLLPLIFIAFFSISLYQLVHYLETLTERQTVLVDELRQAHERLAESSSSRIEKSYLQTLEALAGAISLRDNDTEGHSRRVVNYSMLIADQLGLDPDERKALHWGALLHDLGKLGVPDSILRKPGPLDEREWRIMRKHPLMGYEQLKHIDFLREALPVVLHHHERWDGSGYPAGLKGRDVPLLARIFSVADAFDAMTSDRPYRRGLTPSEACQRLLLESGKQFCPGCLEAWMRIPAQLLHAARADVAS